jgi:F-type H+-transporting ATPase subunit a
MIVPTVQLTSDQQIFWQYGFVKLNETIVTTWAMMIAMTLGSFLITRKLATERTISRWQSALEMIVTGIEGQIKEVGLRRTEKVSRIPRHALSIYWDVQRMHRLSWIQAAYRFTLNHGSSCALRLHCGSSVRNPRARASRLSQDLHQADPIMLPFNIISELSRTLALAIRLFGNMMSGVMIVGILLTITPFIFPIVMTLLGLLTGSVQAYIFSILAAVYIAAATRVSKPKPAAEAQPEPSHA